ncbi:hypothetical protein Salat_0265500 [Sesamum alatum]|uniref:Uncharacterized protein n=1 Tax=Sesamum alatum TaxID=300844 RepID=A0AAE1Z0W7_9LAMI|nr:hypothetical protein Salat_0265500 [Sesamum alatum]
MAGEVGYFGNITYYVKVGEVYHRVTSDEMLFNICVGNAPEIEIDMYVEIDDKVMGSQAGECSAQNQEGGLTEKDENLNESDSFEDSDFDLRNDEANPKKTEEYSDAEDLEKKIEREVEKLNMKEQNEKNKDN